MNNPEIDYIFFAYDTMYNHIDDVKASLDRPVGLGLLPCASYMREAIKKNRGNIEILL